MIKQYDPNQKLKTQWVEVTFMRWDYTKTVVTPIDGNCQGFTVLESAIEAIYEDLEVKRGLASITIHNSQGEELLCLDDMLHDVDWLKEMVVAVKLVEPETKS